MIMTPKKTIETYGAIQELVTCVLPYRAARELQKLRNKLQEEFDIVLQAELAMVKEYGGTTKGNSYQFDTAEQANRFNEAYENFLNQEDDVAYPSVDLSKCVDSIRISSRALEALEPFINFGEV